MHRFQSSSTIVRIRFAALFLWLRWLLPPVVIGVLVYSVLEHDNRLTQVAIGLGMATVLVVIIQWILASRARCPLCMTPVLANKRCAKHRNARTLLGSYRLRAATAILCKGSFYCPYCNEPSAMKIRERRPEIRLEARMRHR